MPSLAAFRSTSRARGRWKRATRSRVLPCRCDRHTLLAAPLDRRADRRSRGARHSALLGSHPIVGARCYDGGVQLRLRRAAVGAPDFRGGATQTLHLELLREGAPPSPITALHEVDERSYSEERSERVIAAELSRHPDGELVVLVTWEEEVAYAGTSRSTQAYWSGDGGATWQRGGTSGERIHTAEPG